MRAMKRLPVVAVVLLGAVALAAAGCGSAEKAAAPSAAPVAAKPTCAHPKGWQRLADRIGATPAAATVLSDRAAERNNETRSGV